MDSSQLGHCSGYYTIDGQWSNGFSCGPRQFCCARDDERICCSWTDRERCCPGYVALDADVQVGVESRRPENEQTRLRTRTSATQKRFGELTSRLPVVVSSTVLLTSTEKVRTSPYLSLTTKSFTWSTPVFPETVVIAMVLGSILLVILCAVATMVYSSWRKRKVKKLGRDSSLSNSDALHPSAASNAFESPWQRQMRLPAQPSVSEAFLMNLLPPPPEKFRNADLDRRKVQVDCAQFDFESSQQLRLDEKAINACQQNAAASRTLLQNQRDSDQYAEKDADDSDCNLTEVSSITFNSDVIIWVPSMQRIRPRETCIL